MTVTINPGETNFQPSTRLIAELKLLEKVAKTVLVGSKTIGGVQYTALLIKGMPLSSRKFRVSNTDVLFLRGAWRAPGLIVYIRHPILLGFLSSTQPTTLLSRNCRGAWRAPGLTVYIRHLILLGFLSSTQPTTQPTKAQEIVR